MAINRIEEYIEGHDYDSFVQNYMVEYFGVDYQTLWEIAKDEFPDNKKALIDLLQKEGIE